MLTTLIQPEMADAFSLAVNIITVPDHGKQFATSAWKILQSGKDGLTEISSFKVEYEYRVSHWPSEIVSRSEICPE